MPFPTLALLALPLALAQPLAASSDVTLSGKECRIKTDLKPKVAKPVPDQIDRYCANFAAFYDGLGLKPKASNKVVIRLFARYDDFVNFWHRSSPGEDPPAAYFSPALNGVVAYHDPDDPYLRQVLFHETSHQYLNRYTDSAPKWANEGLAEYFEGWQLAPDGALIKRRPPFYDLLVLQGSIKDGATLAPKELMTMPPEKFMAFSESYPELHGYLHYATAWGLTWYLLEGPHEADRERYIAFLKRLCDDGDRAEPFAPADWPEWEAFARRFHDFSKAIAVVPETADDHVILASNLRDEGELAEALKHYEAALALAPDTPDVRYWVGYCYMFGGDFETARTHLQKAAQEDEDDPSPLYLLARIASGIDMDGAPSDPAAALDYARQASARANDEDPVYLSFVAQCLHLGGDRKGAQKTMKQVLKLLQDADPEVVAHYQELLESMGS